MRIVRRLDCNRTRGHIFFVGDNHVEGRIILREHDLALKRI